MPKDVLDCVVIGAGPAGLSASLFLARYRHKIVTLHHRSPRNTYSHGVHGFLGHHGITPADLLARGAEEVLNHGGRIVEGCAIGVEKTDNDWFEVTTENEAGTLRARRVLLATGLRDLTPECGGFREFYGSSVFHCPDCDGFEVSDKRVAVLSAGENAAGYTLDLLTWTDKLTLLTDGRSEGLSERHRAKLAEFDISIREETVSLLEGDFASGQLDRVRFADGSQLECDALFFNLGTEPASKLHDELGCRLENDLIWVDETHQTSVAGVYAAGDITPRSQLVVVAAAEGAMAAIHIHSSLVPESRRV